MHNIIVIPYIPYSWKIWWGIKFGGLAVCLATAKLKLANTIFILAYIRMAIPYQMAKFNIFSRAIQIQGPTAKFNSHQYFRLYGNTRPPNLNHQYFCNDNLGPNH